MNLFERTVNATALAEMIGWHQQTADRAKKARTSFHHQKSTSRALEPWTSKVTRVAAHKERRGVKKPGASA